MHIQAALLPRNCHLHMAKLLVWCRGTNSPGPHRNGRFLSNFEDGPLNDCAVRVPEIEKLKEIVQLQASLWHAAQRLPAGAERENALREIRGFQNRMTAFIRRRWQA
jgi:hypothetical protein